MRGGYYRPMYLHALRGGARRERQLVGWHHRIVGQSILTGTPFEAVMVKDGIDATRVEGAATLPYAIPNLQVDLHTTDSRRAGAVVALGRLDAHRVLDRDVHRRACARGGQGSGRVAPRRCSPSIRATRRARARGATRRAGRTPLAAGKAGEKRGRGVAVHESFDTFVAQVAEVTVDKDDDSSRSTASCARSIAASPSIPTSIRAQMEGGIGFGLSAALYGEITLKDGASSSRTSTTTRSLRINEMPDVEVHIVAVDGEALPASASRACRRSRRRSPTRWRRRPASGCGRFR